MKQRKRQIKTFSEYLKTLEKLHEVILIHKNLYYIKILSIFFIAWLRERESEAFHTC